MQGMMCWIVNAGTSIHSNAWTALTSVPPKELRWPLCTGWSLGWCRTLPMPVSIQSYGCCPIAVDQGLMLSHTQCNHSPAWSEQWPGKASEVCLSPPHFKWAATRMRLRASLHCVFSTLMCFLNERSHHSPRNFVDFSTGRSVFPIITVGGLWARDRGAVKCMTLHLWTANLKPFLVAHSCMAFTACCKCIYGVQGAPTTTDCQVINKECSEDVPGNTRGQLINLQSITCHSQDTTIWNTFLWVEFIKECWPDSDSDSSVPEIFWHKKRQAASEANPVQDDTILPGCLICFLQVKEETCCLWTKASRRYFSRHTRWSVVLRCFLEPHWLLSSILDFSRYQMKRVLIMRFRTLHRQLVSAVGL